MNTSMEKFIGSLSSVSFAPSPEDTNFHHFQNEAKNLFLQFANEMESLETDVETIVKYGSLA